MWVHAPAHPPMQVLSEIPAAGLLFVPRTGLTTWDAAEDELAEAFELTRESALAGEPVVYLVDSGAVLGRSAPLDCAVATGLLSGARALAFERRKYDGYASAIAAPPGTEPDAVALTLEFLLSTRTANGQVFMIGNEHLGAALP